MIQILEAEGLLPLDDDPRNVFSLVHKQNQFDIETLIASSDPDEHALAGRITKDYLIAICGYMTRLNNTFLDAVAWTSYESMKKHVLLAKLTNDVLGLGHVLTGYKFNSHAALPHFFCTYSEGGKTPIYHLLIPSMFINFTKQFPVESICVTIFTLSMFYSLYQEEGNLAHEVVVLDGCLGVAEFSHYIRRNYPDITLDESFERVRKKLPSGLKIIEWDDEDGE